MLPQNRPAAIVIFLGVMALTAIATEFFARYFFLKGLSGPGNAESRKATLPNARVNDAGDISWHKSRVFISEFFRGEDIGLEKIEEDFYTSLLLQPRSRRIRCQRF